MRESNRRAVWGWALYDFANSPFTTLVVTFIYATYFARVIAPEHGDAMWARAVSISAIIVAVLAPLLGAVADRRGRRKPLLLFFTVVCIAGSALLFLPGKGDVLFALTVFVVANVAFEMGHVFYNAFLPDLAPAEKLGRVSGFGWALGYLGGLLALIFCYLAFVAPDEPLFGLSKETHENVRVTTLVVAVWFAVFCVPTFLWVPDGLQSKRKPSVTDSGLLRESFGRLASTFREIRQHRNIVRLLIARLLYNDGLMTIFVLGGIYAQGTFGFGGDEIFQFAIVLNVAAGLGAFAMGYLDDRIGGKRMVQISLIALIAATCLAVFGVGKASLWIAGVVVGLFAGPNQSASRSLMARLVPEDKKNEFFGFFAFSGKATNFLGPALYASISVGFDSQRAGMSVVIGLFILGFILLMRVREEKE